MFLTEPGLPNSRVQAVFTALPACEQLSPALKKLGISCFSAPFSELLPEKLKYHADMNMVHLGGSSFVLFDGALNTSHLMQLGATPHFVRAPQDIQYPHDAVLNVKICGDIYFHRLDITDTYLAERLSERYRGVNVRQGYSGCSTAVIGKRAIITGDPGIFAVAKQEGIDALLISDKEILLDGYDHGFIGGCCGMLAPDLLALTGIPKDHAQIELFCSKHGVETIYLTDAPCFDCGGIIPVTQ